MTIPISDKTDFKTKPYIIRDKEVKNDQEDIVIINIYAP